MKPLIWDSPEGYPHKYWMDYNWRPMEERTDSLIFMQGKHLPCEDIGGIKCSLNPKEYDLVFASKVKPEVFTKFDCLPNNTHGSSPVVNKKVLDILNKICPDDIQAFPATIVPEPGLKYEFKNHDYWLINITSSTNIIDEGKTDFLYLSSSLGGQPYGAKRLVLKEKNGNYLLRDKTLKTFMVASPSIAQAFKEANVTGVEFIEDKDYMG